MLLQKDEYKRLGSQAGASEIKVTKEKKKKDNEMIAF
jgi:hypothetical protein